MDAAKENNSPHLLGRNHSVIEDAASDSICSLKSRFALISALICSQGIQTAHRAVPKDWPQPMINLSCSYYHCTSTWRKAEFGLSLIDRGTKSCISVSWGRWVGVSMCILLCERGKNSAATLHESQHFPRDWIFNSQTSNWPSRRLLRQKWEGCRRRAAFLKATHLFGI